MTRYFTAANLWFVAGLVLLLARGYARRDPDRYTLFGSGWIDPGVYWLVVGAVFAAAGFCFLRWRQTRPPAAPPTARPGPAGATVVPQVFAGCAIAVLIPLGLVLVYLAIPAVQKIEAGGHGPGVTGSVVLGCLGVLYVGLLGWLFRALRGPRTVLPQAATGEPAARPVVVAPSVVPQVFAGCAIAVLIPFGLLLVGLAIPAVQKVEAGGHGPGVTGSVVLGWLAVLYVALLGWLFRVLRGPRTALPAPPPGPNPAAAVPGPPAAPAVPRPCPKCGQMIAPGAPEGLCPRCLLQEAFASAPKPSPTLAFVEAYVAPSVEEVAKLFPHMEVVRLIGQGGMGAVYLARQPGLDRFVALKLIRPRENDPTFVERFVREAKAMARLSHPNIVAVHESGEAGGLPYLVMEYVAGVTLRDAMREKKLTPAEALAVVPQICDALEYAHRQGVVHRDIKPENILLAGGEVAGWRGSEASPPHPATPRPPHPVVKIADFGLAKVADPTGVSLTRTDQAMGTPHYMAPEQWEKPAEVDHRADIYALGVVLYELLTGELPLGRFDPPSQKVRLDIRIDEVVLRALAKEPDRRYQHASQVKIDLEQIRTGSGGWVRTPAFREYRSKATFLGWPLVHVVGGIDPATGRQKTARGWLAVGDARAVGGIAVAGGGAVGVFALAGGYAAGLFALAGGCAVGVLGLAGGVAAGWLFAGAGGAAAATGLAVAGGAAVGKFALAGGAGGGSHVFAANRQDPNFEAQLWDWLLFWEGYLDQYFSL
ncbi:MAG: Serine/threonine protein kinase [Gemmataceae bacterium]|nr:Serine/threonine protein kinase [Gemmataceae bacterium]